MKKLKNLILAAGLCLILASTTGCLTDSDGARKALLDAGYTDITITGYNWAMCSDDDMYSTGFTATGPTGRPVKGAVCDAWMKGKTIRLE